MPICPACGGYRSEGKILCPFDQVRNGEFRKGKWFIVYQHEGAGVTHEKDLFGAEKLTVGDQVELFLPNSD